MGRIKQLMVKRATFELLKQDLPFSENFNDDKKILGHTMPSKKIRNKIAGYIARIQKQKSDNAARATTTATSQIAR